MKVRYEQKNSLLFIGLQMDSLLLALKFRDGYNYRNNGEKTAEASLDTVFWEFRKILALGDQSFPKYF